jgi:hypothetical protein
MWIKPKAPAPAGAIFAEFTHHQHGIYGIIYTSK